jgi:hypothetical protein
LISFCKLSLKNNLAQLVKKGSTMSGGGSDGTMEEH